MDKIIVDCRSTALNYTVGQNFVDTPKSANSKKIFTIEIFRLYGP